jgi:hypothetical protein
MNSRRGRSGRDIASGDCLAGICAERLLRLEPEITFDRHAGRTTYVLKLGERNAAEFGAADAKIT